MSELWGYHADSYEFLPRQSNAVGAPHRGSGYEIELTTKIICRVKATTNKGLPRVAPCRQQRLLRGALSCCCGTRGNGKFACSPRPLKMTQYSTTLATTLIGKTASKFLWTQMYMIVLKSTFDFSKLSLPLFLIKHVKFLKITMMVNHDRSWFKCCKAWVLPPAVSRMKDYHTFISMTASFCQIEIKKLF